MLAISFAVDLLVFLVPFLFQNLTTGTKMPYKNAWLYRPPIWTDPQPTWYFRYELYGIRYRNLSSFEVDPRVFAADSRGFALVGEFEQVEQRR
jgi:hypothetical protein